MKSTLLLILATTLTTLAISCGGSPAGPSLPVSVGGAWNGTGMDSQGGVVVAWALTQMGSTVSGTVKTQTADPTDGTCNSCHRDKTGTFSGTIAGTTLTLTMFFPTGGSDDPTPACTATLTGATSTIAGDTLTASYSGADSCEGPFLNGMLIMRRP